MCTGRIARVRCVIAACAAAGSRLSVTGSMSANTGRARSYSAALADATNEKGLVITSSPSPTPAERSARCRPAVPLLTALASGAPTRAANALSNCARRGPSDSWPERSTSITARSSASPSTGRASGITSPTGTGDGPDRGPPASARAPASGIGSASTHRLGRRRGPLAGLHAVLDRVHQRVPGGCDHVLGHSDRAPYVVPVGSIDQHARDRCGALALIEDAHLEVDQLDVAQVRMDLTDGLAQRVVQRIDRPVALGGAHVALAAQPDLDGGLGLDLAVGALLHEHAPGLQAKQRLVLAGPLAPHQLPRDLRAL